MRIGGMIGLLLAALSLAGCGSADELPDYRYRLTVEVETPEGLRTGSSVIEVSTSVASEYSIPTPGAVHFRARGEAVTVDLGNGQTLFALLRSAADADWAGNLMFRLAPRSYKTGRDGFLQRYNAMLRMREPRVLPRYFRNEGHLTNVPAWPMLVTFGDLDDPTSVERVDPDDFAASFGEGVSLKPITVQMTDDPVTTGIEERLGWLGDYYDKMLDGHRIRTIEASNRLANNLSKIDFLKE